LAGSFLERIPFLAQSRYDIGALSPSLVAYRFDFVAAILAIAAVTFVSGAIVAIAMQEYR
jgi:hypothetical protein